MVDRDGWNKIAHEQILNQSLLLGRSFGCLGGLGLLGGFLGRSNSLGNGLLGLFLGSGFGDFLLGGFSLELKSFSLLGSPGVVKLLILAGQLDGSFPSLDLVLLLDSLSSNSGLCDESLDLWGFLSLHLRVLLACEGSSDGVLLDEGNGGLEGLLVLSSLNTEEFLDASGSLGTQSSRSDLVSESGNFLFTLLDDGEGEHLDIGANNAASD